MRGGPLALGLVLSLIPCLAAAWGDGLGVAVDVSQVALDLDYPQGEVQRTRSTRIGIALYESTAPWFQPGLAVGHLRVHQSGNPATQGMDPTGQYLGLRVHSLLYNGSRVGLHGRASYTYFDSDDEHDDLTTQLRWYETELGLGGHVRFGRLALGAGGTYRHIDGDQLTRGAENTTRSVSASTAGPYLQAVYWTDATGTISARYEAGDRYAAKVTFARRF